MVRGVGRLLGVVMVGVGKGIGGWEGYKSAGEKGIWNEV